MAGAWRSRKPSRESLRDFSSDSLNSSVAPVPIEIQIGPGNRTQQRLESQKFDAVVDEHERSVTAAQRPQIPTLLSKGANAFSYRGDLWTRRRLATVLQREFGVKVWIDSLAVTALPRSPWGEVVTYARNQ